MACVTARQDLSSLLQGRAEYLQKYTCCKDNHLQKESYYRSSKKQGATLAKEAITVTSKTDSKFIVLLRMEYLSYVFA